MSEKPSSQHKEQKARNLAAVWLILAFVPSVVALLLLPNPSLGVGPALLILSGGCCWVSGFGIVAGVKDSVVRFFAGFILGGVFFLLNVIIVVLIGCSGTGRIAP
jgi:hypothetical protein